MLLLPTSYLPPVSYYALLLRHEKTCIELYEHFPKQTWRNRCSIYSPNGIQHLVIPLSGRKDKTLTRDIRIDYSRDWQTIHWRSLEAAYRSSPFFEYYENDLREFYESRIEMLVDFNTRLLKKTLELLEIKKEISFTDRYDENPAGYGDFREILSKENVLKSKNFPRYMQVFENKHGFIPNLGIADLLFNLGPQAVAYLQRLSVE